jgi:hypothetical protein
MVGREIYKTRLIGEEAVHQTYHFGMKENYVKYRAKKKNPLHHFLRNVFLKGVPPCFLDEKTPSASRITGYRPITKIGLPVYKERELKEAIPLEVEVYPNSSHFFSSCVEESNAFIDSDFQTEDHLPIIPSGFSEHENVQKWFMRHGLAEAMEVPVWGKKDLAPNGPTEITGFIDLLVYFHGKLWILDYKPDADKAKNKNALSQLLTYNELLKQHGINAHAVAWFDEKTTYVYQLNP